MWSVKLVALRAIIELFNLFKENREQGYLKIWNYEFGMLN